MTPTVSSLMSALTRHVGARLAANMTLVGIW